VLKNVLIAAALVLAPFGAPASQLPDYPFIHANGNGTVYVAPDVGEIDFEIVGYHADPEAARQIVEGRIAEIRTLVAGLELAEGDVAIRDVRKETRKGDSSPPGVVQYDIKCGVHIRVADLTKWRALVSPLINMANLDGFITGFDTSKREQIETELTGDAIKIARRKAEAIASGFGRKLGPVSAVSSGDLKNLTRAMGLAVSDPVRLRGIGRNEDNRDSLLMITVMTLAQSVDVIFRIK
jgi:uncharacterized protein YggE